MKVSKSCRFIFLFGTRLSQAGWLVLGCGVVHAVYRNNPDTAPSGIGDLQSWPILVLGLALLGAGISKGRAYVAALETGKQMSGRVLKIEEDHSGDETEYKTSFECEDISGNSRVFR